jgi:hypothetical protein
VWHHIVSRQPDISERDMKKETSRIRRRGECISWFLVWPTVLRWRWRRHVPPKHWTLSEVLLALLPRRSCFSTMKRWPLCVPLSASQSVFVFWLCIFMARACSSIIFWTYKYEERCNRWRLSSIWIPVWACLSIVCKSSPVCSATRHSILSEMLSTLTVPVSFMCQHRVSSIVRVF